MTRFLAILFGISFAFTFFSCQRDNSSLPPAPTAPPEKVQVSISGRVLDDQNLPVSGAMVKAGNLTANTDLNGNFLIKNITIDANAGFVKVEKAGFFAGSRTFKAIKGSTHYVSIQLIKKNNAGTFNSTTGGSITVPNGGTLNFEPGTVINAQNNTAYTGTVSVSAFLLNPAAENFWEIMPGELRGIDENNKQVGLQSFGMMAVEMTGAGGEHLQLAPSKFATMKFPIAAAQQGNAPATIPFWSFNDTTGLWKQEGIATKQGNEYIGKASHFSFWNVDVPFPLVDFKTTIKDQDGNPVKVIRVIVQTVDEEIGMTGSMFTDSAGVVAGFIPAGKRLKLSVLDKCDNYILSQEIGPFSGTTDLGIINITIPADKRISFIGDIVDCNGFPVTNGYAEIGIQGIFQRAPIENGVLNYSFITCSNQATKANVRIVDAGHDVVGQMQEYDIIGNSVALNQVITCNSLPTEYMIYKIDTISRYFLAPAYSLYVDQYQQDYGIYFETAATENLFDFRFTADPSTSTNTVRQIQIIANNITYIPADQIILNISEYGQYFISGTFTGKMKQFPATPAEFPISGRFRFRINPSPF